MNYTFTTDMKNISFEQLTGFFVDWQNPPSVETHYKILLNSNYVVIAIDDKSKDVIGFITAISDKTLSAYIPLLEVLPEHQNKGIGKKLVKMMFEQLSAYYMIDVICDEDIQYFYKKIGLKATVAMVKRNYKNQKGIKNE